jgi:hypothetical protein
MAEQDYAWIEGECVFDDIGAEKAVVLADLIRQQPVRPTKAWGEPVVDGGKVMARLRYGPVCGAWPAGLRRAADKLRTQAEAGGTLDVADANRTVLMSRAEYDKAKASGAPPPPQPPAEYEDEGGVTRAILDICAPNASAEMKATYERMGSPDVLHGGAPAQVEIGDDVYALFPNGLVSGKGEQPRPFE